MEGDTLGVSLTPNTRPETVTSTLQAWDPIRGEIAWEIPLSGIWNAGTMTTAGNLVFQGRSSGDLVAYDASNGEELWTFNAGLGISAPPISYSIAGKQFISLLVGWGGGFAGIGGRTANQLGWAYGVHPRRLLTFSLNGSAELPPAPPPTVSQPLSMPEFQVDLKLARQGAAEYGRCYFCHGGQAISGGMAPDLRASAIVASDEAFANVVRDGSASENGMPVFANLTDDELLALRHFVRLQAELTTE
jgi:quinohemoprotein ethanol dehydrogenase